MWSFPSSSVQYQLNVSIPVVIIYIFTYTCHSIRNDGLYLVSEHVYLWENVSIGIVINYDWWPIRVKSNLLLGLHSWREYVAYPILWNFVGDKGSVFVVAFGGLISCLPTGFTWPWILPPSSVFFSYKVSFWHSWPFEIDFEYPGEPM